MLVDSGKVAGAVSVRGMNPFQRTADEIAAEIRAAVVPEFGGGIAEIWFYGAGVTGAGVATVRQALADVFPRANRIETESDLVGAARALFGDTAGIACILGTGSNSALYDGGALAAQIPPLGFILGDECSGAVLGRTLLADCLKKQMPEKLRTLFIKEYNVELDAVLQNVYRNPQPNRYLASFAPFLTAHLDEAYCTELVRDSFRQFARRNILPLPDAQKYPLGFVGSIAWHLGSIIRREAVNMGFGAPVIIRTPGMALAEYHR